MSVLKLYSCVAAIILTANAAFYLFAEHFSSALVGLLGATLSILLIEAVLLYSMWRHKQIAGFCRECHAGRVFTVTPFNNPHKCKTCGHKY